MNDLKRFDYEGQQVRTVSIDGEARFVLSDLCSILGLSNPSMVAGRIDTDALSSAEVIDSMGRKQLARIVSEAGLYEVIFMSRKDEARAFKHWVTAEVLPAIRKTGSYLAAPQLTEDQIVAQALQITTAKISELEAKVKEDEPKVEYIDTFVADGDLLQFRHVAATLGTKESELRELLIKRNWIYVETATRWSEARQGKELQRRYSAYAAKKPYFQPVMVHDAPRFRGEVMHTLKITPSGAAAIAKLYRRAEDQQLVVV